ncbi:hypothetical protein HDE78_003911 [Rhodanobacter sp. K2T2]|uniref:hypothetical protein n=1 Tax=Rhodanobacter sp. K2T2 TaxID=2723085 RepID=UPI0015CBFBEC|nr:hypothetical protein [Rhodanobacter sp. K2T2]NYE30934.1 hypothetical protein [Rhodanobacter sp. K2T2]
MRTSKASATLTPRFDFGDTTTASGEIGTLKELLAEINQEQTSASAKQITIQTLSPVLEGIRKIIGRDISRSTVAPLPLADLKVVKLLYRENILGNVHLFDLIAPPAENVKANLEFRIDLPIPRTKSHTHTIMSILEALETEISSDRLASIKGILTSLPETLVTLETQNLFISRQLGKIFKRNAEAKALAYRKLADAINAYTPHIPPAANSLPEAIYTYLHTLRFAHFANGYQEIVTKASIKAGITPIKREVRAFYSEVGERIERRLFLDSGVTTIAEFPSFVRTWAPQLKGLVVKATGKPTSSRQLLSLVDRATRVLHMYCFLNLGERISDTAVLSPLDCVAALCTIRHEQVTKTVCVPYWHGQKQPGGTLLGQLKTTRPIEDLLKDDYVPHEINQLIYNRWCAMGNALLGTSVYHDAWMAFQAARIQKYAECLRSNDIDVITKAVLRYQRDCLGMVPTSKVKATSHELTVMERASRWVARET